MINDQKNVTPWCYAQWEKFQRPLFLIDIFGPVLILQYFEWAKKNLSSEFLGRKMINESVKNAL